MNHLAETIGIARQIEEHAAVAVEQVGRGSHSPVRPGGGSMHDDVATVRVEVVAYVAVFQQIQFSGGRRQNLVGRGELLRQISSNEARAAGD